MIHPTLLSTTCVKIHQMTDAIFEIICHFLHHPSVSLYIIPLNVFNWKTFLAKTYTLDKNSQSKWNIQTFEWLGENSQNASCHIWHCKSVFPLNFALLFSVMKDNSSVLFQLKLYIILTKIYHQSAKFQTFNFTKFVSW